MSYNSPPKTKYGDDWSDDSWSQSNQPQTNTSSPTNQQNKIYLSQPSIQPYSSQQAQPIQTPSSLTPEDMLFLRSWQRDAFFHRVVPLCIAGMGSLFLYNRSKNLPHKLSRYALVFFGSYTIGKMSYADELRKRIMTNPSNTPFMQATRKLLKLNPIVSDEFGSNQASDFAQDTTFTSTWGGSPDVSSVSEFEIKGPNPFGEGTNFGESGSIGDTNREESKPLLSYEELRARNRGLTK